MKQVVEFVQLKYKENIYLEKRDGFQPRKDKRQYLLQKMLCWILDKMGAYYISTIAEYERITIKPLDFIETIFEQIAEVENRFDIRPTKMLIGATNFEELMNSIKIQSGFTFQTEYLHNRQLVGLDVEIIPWMKGN